MDLLVLSASPNNEFVCFDSRRASYFIIFATTSIPSGNHPRSPLIVEVWAFLCTPRINLEKNKFTFSHTNFSMLAKNLESIWLVLSVTGSCPPWAWASRWEFWWWPLWHWGTHTSLSHVTGESYLLHVKDTLYIVNVLLYVHVKASFQFYYMNR